MKMPRRPQEREKPTIKSHHMIDMAGWAIPKFTDHDLILMAMPRGPFDDRVREGEFRFWTNMPREKAVSMMLQAAVQI